jgi:TatD DNase family protein
VLIDTHAHLYVAAFEADRAALVERALQVCSHILLPNIDRASQPSLDTLAETYPGRLLPMAGLHPCSVVEAAADDLDYFEALLATGRYVAVGETGIDLYWDKTTLAEQRASLERHIAWAKRFDLPLVLHSRNAHAETVDIVRAALASPGPLRGVFHCFTGNAREAQEVVDLGFYVGIGGTLTYKKQEATIEALQVLDRQWVVLETDAPYLPPTPYRGQRNESSYLVHTAQKLAEVWGVSAEEVAAVTTENARRLFRLS